MIRFSNVREWIKIFFFIQCLSDALQMKWKKRTYLIPHFIYYKELKYRDSFRQPSFFHISITSHRRNRELGLREHDITINVSIYQSSDSSCKLLHRKNVYDTQDNRNSCGMKKFLHLWINVNITTRWLHQRYDYWCSVISLSSEYVLFARRPWALTWWYRHRVFEWMMSWSARDAVSKERSIGTWQGYKVKIPNHDDILT